MKILKRILLTLAVMTLLMTPASLQAAGRAWEQQKSERQDAHTAAKWNEVEIKTVRGAIIVNTNVKVQIKIFTILGQIVSSETLSPGTWQLQMPAHGVYIVKTADATCKVAV
ncbi:MAG: hypothetical protein HDS70_04480 [Bacteroidales bacterium]|nr:hypothetical protein [Bacteroidales bacterium]MBD5212729.1 hypothetical protein [Bacteroidales bacterium]MBD5217362.1 hypothetical protein [Bacteroidales bacterium]MBD5221608.1 hypothetical protein [Bacteroidales bacterium]